MVHLLEPTHCASFVELMEQYMPNWRHRRDLLNHLPAA
jgi:predicted metal-dependent hydrolase